MTTQQPEAIKWAERCEHGYPLTGDAISAAAELRRQHARITELESQLAQRFDAADMATASAQGFMDGVASVSAGSEPTEQQILEAAFAPAQPAVEASRFGSPELQAMIIARCVEKDQADSVLEDAAQRKSHAD